MLFGEEIFKICLCKVEVIAMLPSYLILQLKKYFELIQPVQFRQAAIPCRTKGPTAHKDAVQ